MAAGAGRSQRLSPGATLLRGHARWIAPLALALFALVLRADGARRYWLNADEGIYYAVAHSGSAEQRRAAIEHNSHPPLFYQLLRASAQLGSDPLLIRLPSLLFGTLAVVAFFGIGRELGGAAAGGFAAALLAASPGSIMLAQTARPYATQLGALAVALWLLLRWWRTRAAGPLAAYAVLLPAAVLLHYSSAVVVAAVLLVIGGAALAGRLDARRLAELALAHAPAGLALAWISVAHLRGHVLRDGFHGWMTGWLAPFFPDGPGALWGGFVGVVEYLAGAELSGVAVLGFGLALGLAAARRAWLVLGFCAALLGLAAGLALLGLYPLGGTRHAAYLALALLPTLGWAMGESLRLGRRSALLLCAVLVGALLLRAPLSRAVGRPEGRWRAHPEIGLARAPLEAWLAPRLAALRETPGVLLMDQFTAYSLLPFFRDGGRDLGFADARALRPFRFGERDVVVAATWLLGAEPELRGAPRPSLGGATFVAHLADQLGAIRAELPALDAALARDLRVLSASGPHLARRLLAGPGGGGRAVRALEVLPPALALFRLDLPAYERALGSARGAAPAAR